MKKSELQRKCTNDDYLSCFSPNEDNDNYYLSVPDIMRMLGTHESTTGKNLRRLKVQGKLNSVKSNMDNRVYYCLRVDDE